MAKRNDGKETRRKILTAAARLFSENGFRQTSNVSISKACGVNGALINYYFGDKETVYREAWQYSFEEAQKKYPADGGAAADAPARERLHALIASTVRHYSDPECFDCGILNQEIASPTGLLEDAQTSAISPLRERLSGIAREYLGDDVPENDLNMAVQSIVTLCTTLQKDAGGAGTQTVDDRVAHAFRVSVGGLDAVKNYARERAGTADGARSRGETSSSAPDSDSENFPKPKERPTVVIKRRYIPKIRNDECKGCERCIVACPKDVLALGKELNIMGLPHIYVKDEDACIGCALCFYTCPEPGAIAIIEEREVVEK